MAQDKIVIRGAREHNLKNIDVEIPRDKLVVITGLSGSGKSSLAFDTIYAEGQRRYVESLSAYARQFLGQMKKPDVDHIDGLSPAISIDQKGTGRNPRSTVGTVTEIYDYLRLLYARVGTPHCPKCGRAISQQSVEQIADATGEMPAGARILILAPIITNRKGEHRRVFEDLRKSGYVRARVNGEVRDLDEEIELERYKMHTIEAVVDRLVIPSRDGSERADEDRARLTDSVETALRLGKGVMFISDVTDRANPHDHFYSEHFACVHCGISLPEIEPRTFSFNSPHGACSKCGGLGVTMELDPDLLIPDKTRTIRERALAPWKGFNTGGGYYAQIIEAVAKHYGFSTRVPVRDLPPKAIDILLHGSRGESFHVRLKNQEGRVVEYDTTYEGLIPNLERRYKETDSDGIRRWIEGFMATQLCVACQGARLRPEALAVTIDGLNVSQVTHFSVTDALAWVEGLEQPDDNGDTILNKQQHIIARQILKELKARLQFMVNVGLNYLTLDRRASTLSGGEAQRIRLATQIGSQLMGVLYILDEPTIGLHQRDNARLIRTLTGLRDVGNTVLVVEHDAETIRAADYVLDLGPGAGEHGGEVVAAGTVAEVMANPASLTGQYLNGARRIPVRAKRRVGNGDKLIIRGARANNLKDIDVHIPLGKLVCVTGVSGSGKSSLIVEVLYRRLAQIFYRAKAKPSPHDDIENVHFIDKVVNIDQSPIGRTPRSNPATYTDAFTPTRELFSKLPEAKTRGYKPGRFSFNVKGGRCEACRGDGVIKIEMQFLPDVYVPCEVCHGRRYNRAALEIKYKGKNIADVLDMTVEEALEFFKNIPRIRNKLKTLNDVGLGYIKLGQPATTLSGGEAQRVKLSKELSRRATGKTLYILDEPTTGLHFADVEKLMAVLHRLTDKGNTVLIIEHHLDVVYSADWLIDLGPEGGDKGGYVVAEGTPETVARVKHSYTGQYLRKMMEKNGPRVSTD